MFHFLFDIISIIVPDPNLTKLKAIIYVKKDHFWKGCNFVPQETDITSDEPLTSILKTFFNQSNVLVNIIDIEKYDSLNKFRGILIV